MISIDETMHRFGLKDKNVEDGNFSVTCIHLAPVRVKWPTYFPTAFSITLVSLPAHKNTHCHQVTL